jgi:hypothetical protein
VDKLGRVYTQLVFRRFSLVFTTLAEKNERRVSAKGNCSVGRLAESPIRKSGLDILRVEGDIVSWSPPR